MCHSLHHDRVKVLNYSICTNTILFITYVIATWRSPSRLVIRKDLKGVVRRPVRPYLLSSRVSKPKYSHVSVLVLTYVTVPSGLGSQVRTLTLFLTLESSYHVNTVVLFTVRTHDSAWHDTFQHEACGGLRL